mmetsp:Transcript_41486/g.133887  ORF Transcript_41486/g.133887 Transcript_41486/m.133887 type:complete len:277 (+) Transcript_41486:159-989(+)
MQPLQLCVERPEEELAGKPALGPRAADDLVVDAVVQPRDGDKDRRPQGLQVVQDLEGVSLVEADGRAAEEAEVHHDRLEDVREREVGDVHLLRPARVVAEDGDRGVRRHADGGEQVAVGEHGALWVARRARGVAEVSEVCWRRLRQRSEQAEVRAPHAFQLAEREDRQALCRRGAAELGGQTARDEDGGEGGCAVREQNLELRSGAQHCRHRRLALDVAHRLGSQRVVHRHDDHVGLVRRERAHHPVAAVLEEEAEEALPVSGARHQAQVPQRRRD